ncbi:hypothetical protein CDAR_171361 [Caerostris darwini]|uniref:Uncharacterized protein n=1 Tax=Caerostris darwini TaxID=1538125 RepID=A0AAV4WMG1_9ARAC|nr:hypothetical protein CDAR_171361 [Caerostris darwini]
MYGCVIARGSRAEMDSHIFAWRKWVGVGWVENPSSDFKKCIGRDHNAYHNFNLPPQLETYGCVISRGSRVEMDGHIFSWRKPEMYGCVITRVPQWMVTFFPGENVSLELTGIFRGGVGGWRTLHPILKSAADVTTMWVRCGWVETRHPILKSASDVTTMRVNLERFQVFDFPGFLQFDGGNLSSHSGMFGKAQLINLRCINRTMQQTDFYEIENRAEMFHLCDGVHRPTISSSKTASLTKISGIIWATAFYGWLLMINVHQAIETRLTLAQLATIKIFHSEYQHD